MDYISEFNFFSNYLLANLIDTKGNTGDFYIHPITGDILGKPIEKKPIFEFATNLHRSLFLKSTGSTGLLCIKYL